MSVTMMINEELNGIELYFNMKPGNEVLSNLKSNGFRWSAFKKCWYTKQTEKAFQVANSLTNSEELTTLTKKTNVKNGSKKHILSLWDATRWNELELSQQQKDQDTKEIAKEIRTHIRKRFPQCKFSVVTGGSYLHSTINFYIKSSPYEKGSMYLNEVIGYCKNLLDTYKHCYSPSDPYTDYAGSYNFYGYVEIHWDYIQTEATEEIKKDMQEFDSKFAEFEKAEEERKEQEFQEYMKQQEIKNAEFKKQQEEEKKQVDNIYNSIEVNELEEIEQYFVTGCEFADLNKRNTLGQYIEEVEKGKYSTENVKVTKEIHFNNHKALVNFSKMLLNDFDFLTNTGGSYTDDTRINSMTDFHNMEDYERKTVKWNRYGVAIYYNNELLFIVDPQGYSYSRYVALTDNAKIEKDITVEQIQGNEEIAELRLQADQLEDISTGVISDLNLFKTWKNEAWKEYKEAIKNKLNKYKFKLTKEIIQQLEIEDLKEAMYKLLQEVDGIQDQFNNAEFQQGDKLTLFYISDWGSIVTHRIIFDSVTNTKYAQYDNAIKLTFTQEKKRKLHYKYFYSTLLVYRGWHSIPDDVLHHVEVNNNMRITRSKYSSCDNRQYDEILNHFQQLDLKPIVNTHRPQF